MRRQTRRDPDDGNPDHLTLMRLSARRRRVAAGRDVPDGIQGERGMMNRMNARLLGAIVGGVTLLGLAASPVLAQDQSAPKVKHQDKDSKHESKQEEKQEKKQEKQDKKDEKAAA